MRPETRELRESDGAETRFDPASECLQEDVKVSEGAEHRSFLNACYRSSPQIICLCVSVAISFLVILVLIIVIAGRSPVQETQQQCSCVDVPALCGPACPPAWIGYEGKCYFFSDGGRNWTSSQSFCASFGSSLAVIENEPEKAFLVRYKCSTDHWIGLQKDPNRNWKWSDGTELNSTLEVKGEGDCAFLNAGSAFSSRCYIQRNWICSHHDAHASHKNSSIRR